jgi:hypothetical protein
VNGNREKQVFILAKVGFVSNINGCENLHYGFGFSIKVDVNPPKQQDTANMCCKRSKTNENRARFFEFTAGRNTGNVQKAPQIE